MQINFSALKSITSNIIYNIICNVVIICKMSKCVINRIYNKVTDDTYIILISKI